MGKPELLIGFMHVFTQIKWQMVRASFYYAKFAIFLNCVTLKGKDDEENKGKYFNWC